MNINQVRRAALSLPETNEEPHHDMSSFRVKGKIFATVPPGDEYLHVFVDEEEREPLLATEPDAYEKLWWGSKVMGLRVTLEKADNNTVSRLLESAWRRRAPKRLLAALDAAR